MLQQPTRRLHMPSSKPTLGEANEIEFTHDPIPESDIADQYYNNMLSHDVEEVDVPDIPSPPRPGSRLDFNANEMVGEVEADIPVFGPKPLRFEWTKSLFQKIGIHRPSSSGKTADKFPKTLTLQRSFPQPSSSRSPSSSLSLERPTPRGLIDDIQFTLCAHGEEGATDDEASDEESEIDFDSLSLSDFDLQDPDARSSSVPEATIDVSLDPCILSTSFFSSPNLEKSVMPSPSSDSDNPPKPKFSCLPSCLSPRFLSKSRPRISSPSPQRHGYEHRGHSRHALMHLKWFWATREEEWAEYENATRAYGGIVTSPEPSSFVSRFPRLFASSRIPNSKGDTDGPSPPLISMPPMTVHPRWGDLSGPKDSWCVHLDRYFVEVPIWRIRKSLWTADLQVMSMVHQRRRAEKDDSNGEEDEADTESLMHMSMLTGLSDDSDLTLVESDCEGEAVTRSDSDSENVEVAEGGKDVVKPFYHNDDEELDEYFEDVDLDSPSSSSSMRASSSTCGYTPPSSKTTVTSSIQSPTALPPQPASSFHPPYSPYCSTPNLLQGLGHPWATSWYQRSRLLLQLLAASAEQEKLPSGLGIDLQYEKNHQQRGFTYEDSYPGVLEKSTSSRLRTVSV